MWWAKVYGLLGQIGNDAENLADEVERPGSALGGLFEPDRLRALAHQLDAAGSLVVDCRAGVMGTGELPDPV